MTYTRKTWHVAAIKWKGDNFSMVMSFLINHIGSDCAPYTSYDEFTGMNMLQFYAWDNDHDVSPGDWIVVRLGSHGEEGEVMSDDDFTKEYEAEGDLD